ncbi:MAG TPA: hypothetical protein VG842_02580, partial [Sediminibacterium sp.]|nr:hypothetical protein [Sediminibacterium sp.]
KLPPALLASLYKDHLIQGEEPVVRIPETVTRKEEPTAKKEAWFLGSNLQKITLLVSEKEAVYVSEASLQLLTALLGACRKNLGDVAIVNLAVYPMDYETIKARLLPTTLLLFGIPPATIALPFTIPDYQVQSYDHCQILIAPALSSFLGESADARLEKSKLWLCLKKIFNL